jgi:C1A family cysteine protease
MVERKYGWRPDKPDFRDRVLSLPWKSKEELLKGVDLRKTGKLPPVYDQGDSSSCTAQSIGAAIEYAMHWQSRPDWTPSRLFIYYNEREMEGTINFPDAGAEIRNGIKSTARQGYVDENLWPFDLTKVTEKPYDSVYQEASKNLIKQYSRVPIALHNIQNVLIHRIPIVFGMSIYGSFESEAVAQTGIVPMPNENETMRGGHAMLIVGYNDTHFIVRNSWGASWGEEGYCYIPIEYLTNPNLADDFWAIFLVA